MQKKNLIILGKKLKIWQKIHSQEMEGKKFIRLLAILALVAVMSANSTPLADKAQKSEAQLYYDQFPADSKYAKI